MGLVSEKDRKKVHNPHKGSSAISGVYAVEPGLRENSADSDRRAVLRELVTNSLSTQERLVVVLYYHESLTFSEIACVLELSESRVSQIHRSILLRLQTQVEYL
ncbi:MAG: sigma-70 family RNA polymerase sigma factor [Planctomycetota bacterium]